LRSLRLALIERQRLLEQYMAHLVEQWRVWQANWKAEEMSYEWVRTQLHVGSRLAHAFLAGSVLALDIDGVDPSKFCTPRLPGPLLKAIDKLPRLVLHVGGSWSHWHAFQIAVSDADQCKDSNAQAEMSARILSTSFGSRFCRCFQGLPWGQKQQPQGSRRLQGKSVTPWKDSP
jgi:hypothetical protein